MFQESYITKMKNCGEKEWGGGLLCSSVSNHSMGQLILVCKTIPEVKELKQYNIMACCCFITTCLSICVLKVNLHTNSNTLFLCFYLNIGTVN